MKNAIKAICYVLVTVISLAACEGEAENKIEVIESRGELPEPDKALRIEQEINSALNAIPQEIKNTEALGKSKSSKKLVNSGMTLLPYLMKSFGDNTATMLYSKRNKRTLTRGELAILVASKIKPIPIAAVVGVQQCTPPFNNNIETYLDIIAKNPEQFLKNYRVFFGVKPLLTLDTFSEFPKEMDGCSCYFSSDSLALEKGEFVYLNDLAKTWYLKVNGKLTKFSQTEYTDISKTRMRAKAKSDKYEVTIIVIDGIENNHETWVKTGTITLKDKQGNSLKQLFYGECGC